MSKLIDFKKAIAKREEKETEKEDDLYMSIDDIREITPLQFDQDTAEIDELISLISYTLAVRTAERFMEAAYGTDESGIRMILSTVEEMPSREAVRLLRTLFISNGMPDEAENLELLDLCAEFNKDVYEYFTDFFLQTDEIDPYLVANWIREPEVRLIVKVPGGGHDKNYCHM